MFRLFTYLGSNIHGKIHIRKIIKLEPGDEAILVMVVTSRYDTLSFSSSGLIVSVTEGSDT